MIIPNLETLRGVLQSLSKHAVTLEGVLCQVFYEAYSFIVDTGEVIYFVASIPSESGFSDRGMWADLDLLASKHHPVWYCTLLYVDVNDRSCMCHQYINSSGGRWSCDNGDPRRCKSLWA